MPGLTTEDAGIEPWQLNDEVILLRQWATERSRVMPVRGGVLTIGSSKSSWLQLDDEHGRVSRTHAALSRQEGKWMLQDVGSTNGMLADGVKCQEVALDPGMEVWLGGVTLVAESRRSIALRAFLTRLLGWATKCTQAADLALRSIRLATRRQAALVLCGEDELVLVARALHRRVLGADRPFIVCDPRRKRAEGNVRTAENYRSGMEALPAAKDGWLCIWSKKLPGDFRAMKCALQNPDTRVQLVVCATDPRDAEAFGVVPIVVPPLRERAADLPRIVDEYAHEITSELAVPRASVSRGDQEWIIQNASSSLPEIEKAIWRILRLREVDGDLSRAAALLGMDRWSLDKWVKRRHLPVSIDHLRTRTPVTDGTD